MSSVYSIKSLCIALSVSRSGYYKWLSRKDRLNRYEEKRLIVKEAIKIIHDKHKVYGYRNIASYLRESKELWISDYTCHKLCKELNIRSKARKTYKKPGEESIKFPNIVDGKWNAKRPFEIIVSDSTYIHSNGKGYDWTFYIDTFNNEIVASDIRLTKHGCGIENHHLAYKKLLKEKIKRGYKDLETIVHTDQGAIYSSAAFNKLHENYNITRSMSRIGTPTDNPIIESLNGWMKEELYIDFKIYKSENIVRDINNYIDYYNTKRHSYTLKYKTPVQYRTELGFKS